MARSFFINPLWTVLFLAVMGVAAFLFSLPEKAVALATVAYFAVITLANPANGVVFIILLTPFFLGSSTRPWFWLLEVFVYGCLAAGGIHALLRRGVAGAPLKAAIALLTVSAALSVPTDFKELLYTIWAVDWRDMFFIWVTGHNATGIVYFRILANTVSAILLFIVAYRFFPRDGLKPVERLFLAITVEMGLILLAGLLMLYGVISLDPEKWHYLSLSTVGIYYGSMTVFSYNTQYLSQYLMLCLPLALAPFLYRESGLASRATGVVISIMAVLCLAQIGQRSPVLALVAAAVVFTPLYAVYFKKKEGVKNIVVIAAGFVGVACGLVIALDYAGVAFQKFNYGLIKSDPRFYLWWTAFEMFGDAPATGIGLGRFTALFPHYFPIKEPDNMWRYYDTSRGTAHSLYFQILSEQGALGLLAWFAVTGASVRMALAALRESSSEKTRALAAGCFMVIVIWFFLGVFHTIFYVRSIELFFWITVAALTVAGMPYYGEIKINKKLWAAGALVLMAGAAFQWSRVAGREMADGFSAGFHNPEKQPGGETAIWTGRRAMMKISPKGGSLALQVSAPLPGVNTRPQTATISYCGKQTELKFGDTGWKNVSFDCTGTPEERDAILKIETAYVYNPKAEGVSGDDRNLGIYVKFPARAD